MESNPFNEALKSSDVRNTFESYFKWIINLSFFILTISVSAVGLFNRLIYYSWLILIGWVMLGITIFLNWLSVKRLVSYPFIEKAIENKNDLKAKIMWDTMPNIQIYSAIQNHLFLWGTFIIFLGFVLSWFKMIPSSTSDQTFNQGWFTLVRIGLLYDIVGALVLVFTHLIVGSHKIRTAKKFYRDKINISSMVFTQMDTLYGLLLLCTGFIFQILGQDNQMVVQFSNSKLNLPHVVPALLIVSVIVYLIVRKPLGNRRIKRIDSKLE